MWDIAWIRLFADSGLLILIWMVQLIVYPGFTFYSEADLLKWHAAYTPKITAIVLPLMVTQLGIAIWMISGKADLTRSVYLALVIAMWVLTFTTAVPLHGKITQGIEVMKSAESLVRINWWRTIGWTVIFLVGLGIQFESVK